MKNLRSKVLTYAHKIKANFSTWGEAQSIAWKLVRLRNQLDQGKEIQFKYISSKGERLAKGVSLEGRYQKKTNSNPNYNVFTYFDLDRNAVRCFKVQNYLGVIGKEIQLTNLKAA